jgi:hypothetical protein
MIRTFYNSLQAAEQLNCRAVLLYGTKGCSMNE